MVNASLGKAVPRPEIARRVCDYSGATVIDGERVGIAVPESVEEAGGFGVDLDLGACVDNTVGVGVGDWVGLGLPSDLIALERTILALTRTFPPTIWLSFC